MVEALSGFGLGLRSLHYEDIVTSWPDVDWFEIISEDYLVDGGAPLYYLDQIKERYPLAMHGVSMSLGSMDPLNWDYLRRLKKLMRCVQPVLLSDHCCWTGVDGINLHDLMPMPYTEESVAHISQRIRQVQDFLERPILIENVSSYITYAESTMTEWAFLTAIFENTACQILLDVNNVYVNAFNHGFDPLDYIHRIPVASVKQFHLAGHKHCKTHIIDTHDHDVSSAVWELYRHAVTRFPEVPTLLERDGRIPPLRELLLELDRARAVLV